MCCATMKQSTHRLLILSHVNRVCRYPDDVWIGIMNLLDAKSLLRFAVTNRRFCALAKDDSVWKAVCFREIGLPAIHIRPAFSWRNLYMSAIGEKNEIFWIRLQNVP